MKPSLRWLGVALLAGLYFATAKLGIELSVARGVVTPVWIPAGLSIAALLIFGLELWPGILLGAFAANATSGVSVGVAAGIAVGNLGEGLLGAYLLKRFDFNNAMERIRDVFSLAVFGAGVGTLVAAINGPIVLALGGEIQWSAFLSRFSLWWFGDAMGVLLVAPFVLVWSSHPRLPKDASARWEATVLAVLLGTATYVVFVGGSWRYPYVLFPLLVWAALRFRQVGTATAMLAVSAIAVAGTVGGSVPMGGTSPTEAVQLLQGLLAVVGISLFAIAATLTERDLAVEALRDAIGSLAEAQRLARVGSWKWDVATNEVTWSRQMYEIYGYEVGTPITFETAMERVVEEDRAEIEGNLRRAFETKDADVPVIDYRIRRPDGIRQLRGRGGVHFDDDGRPVRAVGTVNDLTDQRAAEERDRLLQEADFRRRQALQLNDEIVQGLAAAKAARDLGIHEKEETFILATLQKARSIVTELLSQTDETRPLEPGDFVRSRPVTLTEDQDPTIR